MVSGFGSFGVLHRDSGLHVLEVPKDETRFDRIRARVEVAAVPVQTPREQAGRGAKVTAALDNAAGKVEIIRRYRQQPSPLVRDSVTGWRTGRIRQVFEGNFDILG